MEILDKLNIIEKKIDLIIDHLDINNYKGKRFIAIENVFSGDGIRTILNQGQIYEVDNNNMVRTSFNEWVCEINTLLNNYGDKMIWLTDKK